MSKHMALILLAVVLCGVAVALAEPPPPATGKVVAVDEGKVQIAIDGEQPSWVRKNAPVKFTDGVGKILEVTADSGKPVVITVRTKLAASMKAGDAVTFQKGKSMAGC